MAEYNDIWEEIKDKVTLVEEMERHGINLIPSGMKRLRCVCPFHADTTPSMIVNKGDVETFKCFGCQVSGSVIDFIQRIKGNISLFKVIQYFKSNYHLEFAQEYDLEKLIQKSTKRRTKNSIAGAMLAISNSVRPFLKNSPSFQEDLMKIKPYLRAIDEAAYVENMSFIQSNFIRLQKEIKKIKEIRKQIG